MGDNPALVLIMSAIAAVVASVVTSYLKVRRTAIDEWKEVVIELKGDIAVLRHNEEHCSERLSDLKRQLREQGLDIAAFPYVNKPLRGH